MFKYLFVAILLVLASILTINIESAAILP